MTGFGKAVYEDEEIFISAEIKTLNSKYLDLNLRTPKSINSGQEVELRQILTKKIERGKVSFLLEHYTKNSAVMQLKVNEALAEKYYKQLNGLAQKLGTNSEGLFEYCLQMPDVLNPAEQLFSEDIWNQIKSISTEAIESCVQYRLQEGEQLQKYFESYINNIKNLLNKVKTQESVRLEVIRERLTQHQQEISQNEMFDTNRFEQEMIYYIEKLDITEERVRLENHLKYFSKTMQAGKTSGKKLNFIAQEIGREVNTIGAKANDSLIQHWVVEMKEELEKIKEQIQNIL